MASLADLRALLAARGPLRPGPEAQPAPTRSAAPASPAGVPAPAPVNTRRILAAARHADADVDFVATVGDVTRLPAPRRIPHSAPAVLPVPRQRMADEADALFASKFGAEPSPQSWDIGQELEAEQTFLRPGLGSDILTRLRRGHWSLQAELDLHGQTTDEAHDTLADFLAEARQREWRCVRVIHGKGLSSPGKEPVLKGKVRRWLTRWDDVLAYVEPPQNGGGGGAVLVLLRPARR